VVRDVIFTAAFASLPLERDDEISEAACLTTCEEREREREREREMERRIKRKRRRRRRKRRRKRRRRKRESERESERARERERFDLVTVHFVSHKVVLITIKIRNKTDCFL